jgi:phosphoglycolate phosphatase-like HAD superfamily hydrolase
MENIRLAIWDWNGTLWDDVDQWFIAAHAAYRHANIPDGLTLETLRDAFDIPVSDVIHTLGAPKDLPQSNHDALLKTFVDVLAENNHLADTREGAADVLAFMESRGVVNHIASNHPLPLLQAELQKSGLSRFFGTLCGNDNHSTVYTKSTKEDRVRAFMADSKTPADQTCIIADTREEVRIAQRFGMVSIAVTGGYNSERVLRDMNPSYLVHSLAEIPALFRAHP